MEMKIACLLGGLKDSFSNTGDGHGYTLFTLPHLGSSCKKTRKVPKPVDPPDYERGSFVHTHTHVLEPAIPNRYSISAHLLVTVCQ